MLQNEATSKSGSENENEAWDPKEEVDKLLNSLDENETDLTKIATVTHKFLKVMSFK